MTVQQITAKADQAAIPFAVAREIRKLLDEARMTYGADEFDSDDVETRIIELVTE